MIANLTTKPVTEITRNGMIAGLPKEIRHVDAMGPWGVPAMGSIGDTVEIKAFRRDVMSRGTMWVYLLHRHPGNPPKAMWLYRLIDHRSHSNYHLQWLKTTTQMNTTIATKSSRAIAAMAMVDHLRPAVLKPVILATVRIKIIPPLLQTGPLLIPTKQSKSGPPMIGLWKSKLGLCASPGPRRSSRSAGRRVFA
jgi:hypothetical protein